MTKVCFLKLAGEMLKWGLGERGGHIHKYFNKYFVEYLSSSSVPGLC